MKKNCMNCGKEFTNTGPKRVSRSRWITRKHCSQECLNVDKTLDLTKSKECIVCGSIFYRPSNVRGNSWTVRKYCSVTCSNRKAERKKIFNTKECIICGTTFRVRGVKGMEIRKTCSRKCFGIHIGKKNTGEGHPSWNGGKFVTRQGYIRIWISEDDKYASMRQKGSNSVLEHRLIMAQKIGRAIKSSETIHHRNGIRSDNRIENLELRTGPHGVGATHHCPSCTCEIEKMIKLLGNETKCYPPKSIENWIKSIRINGQ